MARAAFCSSGKVECDVTTAAAEGELVVRPKHSALTHTRFMRFPSTPKKPNHVLPDELARCIAIERWERPSDVDVVEVPLPPSGRFSRESKVARVTTALSERQCAEWVRLVDTHGWEPAQLNVGAGRQMMRTDVRKSLRLIVDAPVAAESLFRRIEHMLPRQQTSGSGIHECQWQLVGLNERLRFLKYNASDGDFFAPHQDGVYVRPRDSGLMPGVGRGCGMPGDRSFLTLMLYLNAPESGGATNFLSLESKSIPHTSVKPAPGLVLAFSHELHHEGERLQKGVKLCVRTDVMYRRLPPTTAATGSGGAA